MTALGIASLGAGYGAAVVGERVLACRSMPSQGRRASAGLLPLVAEVVAEAGVGWTDIGLIAVVDGPGSYTGLRVGLATAKGLAMARGLPVAGVDALEALAFAAGPLPGDAVAVAAVPAGRGRLYVGRLRWEGDRPRLVEGPNVEDAATWRTPPGARPLGVLAGGEGDVDPSAVARLGLILAAAGHAVSPEHLLPRYASEPRLGPAPRAAGQRG